MTWSRNVDSKQGTVYIFFNVRHILPQTMLHEHCRDYLRSNYCVSSSKKRRTRATEISRRNSLLHWSYCSSEAEKEAKTRPDHANPLAKKSKAKVKGAVVKVTSPKATSPKFFRGKLPGKQSNCMESPKLLGSRASIWITSIIWWIISCHMDYNHLKDCSSTQG